MRVKDSPDRSKAPFLGRAQEVARALELLSHSHVLLIKGERGIGKTALLGELMKQTCEPRDSHITITCRERQLVSPLLLILNELERLHQPSGPEPMPSPGLLTSGGRRHDRALRTVQLLIDNRLPGHRLFLLIEDLQWADRDFLDFLASLVDLRLGRFYLVCTLGDGAKGDPNAVASLQARASQIVLVGLNAEDSALLAESICGPLSRTEKERLQQITKGNPFFLIQLASHLRESGALERLGFDEAQAQEGLPATLTDLIGLKLGMLDQVDQLVLEAASCLGASFHAGLVEVATELESVVVQDALERWVQLGIITRQWRLEPLQFAFVSLLVREHLYQNTLSGKHREMHRRLAIYGNHHPGVFPLADLALHNAAGLREEQPLSVIEVCTRAAEDAEQQLVFDSAAQLWTLALSAAAIGDVPRRANLLFRLGFARHASRNWAQASAALERAHELWSRLGEFSLASKAAYFIAEMLRFQDTEGCEEWARKALEGIEETLRPSCLVLLGGALVAQDKMDEGEKLIKQAVAAQAGAITPEIAFWASTALAAVEELEDAHALCVAGLQEAIRIDDQAHVVLLGGSLLLHALENLDKPEALKFAGIMPETRVVVDAAAMVRRYLGQAMLDSFSGNWAQVMYVCREWRAEIRLAGSFQQATAELIWAEAAMNLGDLTTALEVSGVAIDRLGQRASLADLHRARYCTKAGRHAEAARLFELASEDVIKQVHSKASLAFLADIAADIGSDEMCASLRAILSTERRPLLMVYTPVSVQRVLGKLAARLGDDRAAVLHFNRAVEQLKTGEAWSELSVAYAEYSRFRFQRGRRGDNDKGRAYAQAAARLLISLDLPLPEDILSAHSKDSPTHFALSSRQLEVLQLVADGLSNREIAERLSLSVSTVAHHVEEIFSKMGVSNRTEATRLASQEGLLSERH